MAEVSQGEAESLNWMMQGREHRIVELKQEVNTLLGELGRKPAYGIEPREIDDAKAHKSLLLQEKLAPELPESLTTTAHEVADMGLEKPVVDIAFIPILCSAPLLYAQTHGYFAANGLQVNLIPAPGWSGVKDLLAFEHVAAAHLLAPMPLAVRQGLDGKPADIRLACIQNVNGQALTLSIKHAGIQSVRDMKGFTFGVPYHFSMHYYLLCLFLAEHGLDPLKDVNIIEVAPPRMPHFMATGRVDGIFAPEPFNQIPALRGTGFIHTLSKEIWPGHPCCGFASSESFACQNPRTYKAMLKSVLQSEAALHHAPPEARRDIAVELSRPGILDQADPEPVIQALVGEYDDGMGRHCTDHDRMDFIPTPWPEYGWWMLSQQQRWNQLRRKVDYRAVVEECFDNTTRDMAWAMGCAQSGPSLHTSISFDHREFFQSMQQQPFCAFEMEDATSAIPPWEERLGALNNVLAKAAGGLEFRQVKTEANDTVGVLETLVNDLIKNMRFDRDALQEQNENMAQRVEQAVADIEKNRKNAMSLAEDAEANRRITAAVNQLMEADMTYDTPEAAAEACLNISQEITGSKFGFVGEVNANGRLDTIALSDPGYEACRLPESTVPVLISNMEIRGIWGVPITTGTSRIINEPDTHPDRVGLPQGHPSLHCFLGVPVKDQEKTSGIIALGNKPGGYNQTDRQAVEELARAFTDVISRVRLQKQLQKYVRDLEHSNQELDDFAYIASHDLKEPLRGINNFVFFLMEDAVDQLDDESRSRLERIQYLCGRLDTFISALLTFSRVGRQELAWAKTDVDNLVKNVLDLNKEAWKDADIQVLHPLPHVYCDGRRVGEVFQNLISNAIKYNDMENKRIEIGHIAQENTAGATSRYKKQAPISVFFVRDNGLGIAPRHQDNIFKIFKRLHGRDKYGGGSGAGLTIVKKIIARHGGNIWLESTPGQGSTFYFTLQGDENG
ncbi:ABC transporter substrate-binding protein [Desulfoplanes sp.]